MRLAAVAMTALALGCAANYYDTYQAKHPDWYGDVPRTGASLHETLAGLYAPPVADYSRFVSKLDVLRLEDGAAVSLTGEELDAAVDGDAPGDYGVVATLRCQSEYNRKRYAGEKVAWYLLPAGKLEAWDHFDFVDLCTVANEFRPARGEAVALEGLVVAHRDRDFPRSMEHVGEFYRKGLAYLAADRPEDAVRMLRAGDAALDVGSRGRRHQDYESSTRIHQNRPSDVERLRATLIEKLGAFEAPSP